MLAASCWRVLSPRCLLQGLSLEALQVKAPGSAVFKKKGKGVKNTLAVNILSLMLSSIFNAFTVRFRFMFISFQKKRGKIQSDVIGKIQLAIHRFMCDLKVQGLGKF